MSYQMASVSGSDVKTRAQLGYLTCFSKDIVHFIAVFLVQFDANRTGNVKPTNEKKAEQHFEIFSSTPVPHFRFLFLTHSAGCKFAL